MRLVCVKLANNAANFSAESGELKAGNRHGDYSVKIMVRCLFGMIQLTAFWIPPTVVYSAYGRNSWQSLIGKNREEKLAFVIFIRE